MNQFEIKARFYELINTKMMHVPITPDTARERFSDALIINMEAFKKGFSAEDMHQIIFNPQMPEPLREFEGPTEEALAIIEVVINEEFHYLTQYLSEKLSAIFAHDFGGLVFSTALLDYKNISSIRDDEIDCYEESDVNHIDFLFELMAAEKIDSYFISGVEVIITQTPTLKRKFGRVNLAGFDFILIRNTEYDEHGRFLSVVSN